VVRRSIFIYVAVVVVFILGLHLFGRLTSSTPPFLLDKLDELMGNGELMDSIGGSEHFEYTYNENDFESKDTLNFSIKVVGPKRILVYKAMHVKRSANKKEWELADEILTISE
jgi:hypothetical protein